jgi:hypothetical protein
MIYGKYTNIEVIKKSIEKRLKGSREVNYAKGYIIFR